MKDLGYGAGYSYDPDAPEGFSGDNYWPAEMEPATFYRPDYRGFEKRIAVRLAWWDECRRERRDGERLAVLTIATMQPCWIGRAASWGRVSQDLSILVVPVFSKKKYKQLN